MPKCRYRFWLSIANHDIDIAHLLMHRLSLNRWQPYFIQWDLFKWLVLGSKTPYPPLKIEPPLSLWCTWSQNIKIPYYHPLFLTKSHNRSVLTSRIISSSFILLCNLKICVLSHYFSLKLGNKKVSNENFGAIRPPPLIRNNQMLKEP